MLYRPNPDGTLALPEPITITCRVCARALPLEQMARDKKGRYGRATICWECQRAYDREKRAARRKAGACIEFGCPERAAPGRTRCADHLAVTAARSAAARATDPERHREAVRATRARRAARTDAEIDADRKRLRPDGIKRCRACGKELDLAEFHEDRAKADGLQNSCRRCSIEREVRRRSEGWSRRRASWESRGLYGCSYCGAPFEETDHAVAVSAEGSPGDVDLNTVPSCWRCNRGPGGKFATPVDEWLARLADEGDPRGVARTVWQAWPRIYLTALEDGTVVNVETGEVVEEGAA